MDGESNVEQTFLSADNPVLNVEQTFLSADQPIEKTRRRLPHWTQKGAIYWITFRLADSLPQAKLNEWRAQRNAWMQLNPEPWNDLQWNEYNIQFGERLDRWLDAGYGSCVLARPEIRTIVQDCLTRFDGERLLIHAGVIMPNHVHLVMEPLDDHNLSALLKGIKGASARACNKLLGTSGQFWLDESFDHIVRSEFQYQHYLRYIAENPTKAGLQSHKYWLYRKDEDKQ